MCAVSVLTNRPFIHLGQSPYHPHASAPPGPSKSPPGNPRHHQPPAPEGGSVSGRRSGREEQEAGRASAGKMVVGCPISMSTLIKQKTNPNADLPRPNPQPPETKASASSARGARVSFSPTPSERQPTKNKSPAQCQTTVHSRETQQKTPQNHSSQSPSSPLFKRMAAIVRRASGMSALFTAL